jgi:RimJ/RimL family protein N-acetyltransferase
MGERKMAMKVILETPRLLLREMGMEDLDFVAEMLAHPDVMRFWPQCYNRGEAEGWIKRQQARYAKDGVGYWLVGERASGQPVGQAGLLIQTVDDREEMGLGYIMNRPFWRRGFAFEAARASMDYAVNKLGRSRVVALVRPENLPSQGLARKLGMEVEKRTYHADYEHLVFVNSSAERR